MNHAIDSASARSSVLVPAAAEHARPHTPYRSRTPPLLVRRVVDSWQSRHISDGRRALAELGKVTPYWRRRIDTGLAAPDNSYIPRVPAAGALHDGFLTMHNGIEVSALGHLAPAC